MTTPTRKRGAADITRKAELHRIHCAFSTSGDVAVDFCKYCRNHCAYAGKTKDEIRAQLSL